MSSHPQQCIGKPSTTEKYMADDVKMSKMGKSQTIVVLSWGMKNPFIQISHVKLEGQPTYLIWSRNVLLFLMARYYEGYVSRERAKLTVRSSTYKKWVSKSYDLVDKLYDFRSNLWFLVLCDG